ncbi:MAG: DUF4349 domain-containing protein [Phycisphaerales bacterium]|nr:DUF4349 domain-containing protein [Phycisphaerales bacterium]
MRRATMTLRSDDVRSSFLSASMLVTEALGEFVQDSSLRGSGENAEAELILRVAAGRLGEAMNALRTLGEVESEAVTGTDVTDQLFDLDARLRNETRIEEELLRLLRERSDADLGDVLTLRRSLDGVRERIERLAAQRDRATREVSLATIAVTIRPVGRETNPKSTPGTLALMNEALHDGIDTLVRSLAWMLRILVGGAAVWAIAIVAGLIAILVHTRAKRAASREPVPPSA